MNLPRHIARAISKHSNTSFSNFIIRLSTIATVISIAVMVVALAVVQGFKDTIKDKTFEFWGHFHITNNKLSNDLTQSPETINIDESKIKQLQQEYPDITSIQPYILGAGLLSTRNENLGIQIKGVRETYFERKDIINYEQQIIYPKQGYSLDVLVSKNILNKLNAQIGDSILLYVLNNDDVSPRVRKVHISGTYHIGIEEIDNNYILCDIALLQRLYNWPTEDISGLQILLSNYNKADKIAEEIYFNHIDTKESILYISDIYADIFQWLDLQDMNAQIILIIMAVVAVINIITAMITYILERLNMIGILKTIGMSNWSIRKIFIYHFQSIIIKGIIGGIILGVLLCWMQKKFQLIKIDESIYYMKYVPIKVELWHILLIIVTTIAISVLILAICSFIINRIKIVDAIKFK